MKQRLAVFASGNGSNFEAIARKFPVEFVFSDHRDAFVLKRAERLCVPSFCFERKEFDTKEEYEQAMLDLLVSHQIDLVALAGYMKVIGPTLLRAYEKKIINIHPSYLPEFKGAHSIEDAWKAGVSQSGVSIHWVDEGIDTGEVICKERVPRLEGDCLADFEARIHAVEHRLYPDVIAHLFAERKGEKR